MAEKKKPEDNGKDNGINDLRQGIDRIDQDLVRLLSERAQIVEQVAKVKKAAGETHFCRLEREQEIIRRVCELNKGPLSDRVISFLFRELMSASLALEQEQKIAYLGPGTCTHTYAALRKQFGHAVQPVACDEISLVFREVEAGRCHYGVVPVENSVGGTVYQTMDQLLVSDLKICAEIQLRIRHFLWGRKPAFDVANIKKLLGHEQALMQCRRWRQTHIPNADYVCMPSAGLAVQALLEGGKNEAAIASSSAGETHDDLVCLSEGIEDDTRNTTRFLVIGQQESAPCGRDKTSVLFATTNKPGALYKLLACFADRDVSMSRLESRPSQRDVWDYVFFVDLIGHIVDSPIEDALSCLREQAVMVKHLGSYPEALDEKEQIIPGKST